MSTQPDMWHGKPEREHRMTAFQTLDTPLPRRRLPMWIKASAVVLVMFGLLLAVKSILHW